MMMTHSDTNTVSNPATDRRYDVWYNEFNMDLTFLIFLTNGWEFLIDFLHTYYTFLSTLDYKVLFNYL